MVDLRASAMVFDEQAVAPILSRPSVVAGIDFGPASLAAARWAFAHVARDAHAILSHVGMSSGEVGNGDDALSSPRGLERVTSALRGGLGGFGTMLHVASARAIVRLGSPSYWLPSLAEEMEAGLIVLGRRSDANRRRIGEPNVIERVTRRTRASVLVVPEGVSAPPGSIIAAIDQSAAGARVVTTAMALADLHGSQVIVLHVVTPQRGEYCRAVGNTRRGRASKERPAASMDGAQVAGRPAPRWFTSLIPTASECTGKIVSGDPAHAIMAEARELGAAMVVVGKRGDDQSPRGSIGSVVRELLASASVPVLAVEADPALPEAL
ncbi:hypothetical protein BH09GEM1_BH09GEM1_47190 [soil metagenome]